MKKILLLLIVLLPLMSFGQNLTIKVGGSTSATTAVADDVTLKTTNGVMRADTVDKISTKANDALKLNIADSTVGAGHYASYYDMTTGLATKAPQTAVDTLTGDNELTYKLSLKANLVSPVFTTPNIGSATGSVSGNAGTVTGFTPASGSLTLSGADAVTLSTTNTTSLTLPTSGTVATTANTVALADSTAGIGHYASNYDMVTGLAAKATNQAIADSLDDLAIGMNLTTDDDTVVVIDNDSLKFVIKGYVEWSDTTTKIATFKYVADHAGEGGATNQDISDSIAILKTRISALEESNKVYYVSNDGSDSNDGLSELTPWQTISKVNASTFQPGNTIKFRRGDQWREQLTVPSSGSSGYPITFTAYGNGDKPIINAADVTTGWADVYNGTNANIWGTVSPNVVTTQAMVVIADSLYTQVATLAEVITPRTYWIKTASTPDSLFVWSVSDPDTRFVEVSKRSYAIYAEGKNYLTISYLDVRNAGQDGLRVYNTTSSGNGFITIDSVNAYRNRWAGIDLIGNGDANFGHNLVTRCVATYNGNGILGWEGIDNSTFSYCYTAHQTHNYIAPVSDGSGLQFYVSKDVVVEHCESYDDPYGIYLDPYDAYISEVEADNMTARYNYVHDSPLTGTTMGISLQGTGAGATMSAYYNLLVNCGNAAAGEVGISLSISGNATGTAVIYNNTIFNDDSHLGTGYDNVYIWDGTGVTFKNNIIYSEYVATMSVMNVASVTMATLDYNQYYMPTDVRFRWNETPRDALNTWVTLTSQDVNSQWGDPVFVNNASDWSLQAESPCIDQGVSVGLTKDFLGNPVVGVPDMGCYERQ